MSIQPFWEPVTDETLRQGDCLHQCMVPVFGPDFSPVGTHQVNVNEYDLIIVTQSCDLEQLKGAPCCRMPDFPDRRI